MSKAVLVVDMPESCNSCRSRYAFGECGVLHRYIEDSVNKPDWCPLRALPDKRESVQYASGDWKTIINNIKSSGYNDCINDILAQ